VCTVEALRNAVTNVVCIGNASSCVRTAAIFIETRTAGFREVVASRR
jgi:hypothetical protein